MTSKDTSRREMITSIKEYLNSCFLNNNSYSIVGPSYQSMNKQVADLYFGIDEELKGIFHLTEAHAATLRQQTTIRYDYKEDQIKNPTKNTKDHFPIAQGIHKQYVEFGSKLVQQEEAGLMTRLREMPAEWTVIQLTTEFYFEEMCKTLYKISSPQPKCLYITRLPCGSMLDEMAPMSIKIALPEPTEGMPTIFDLVKEAKDYLRTKKTKEIRKARKQAAENMQSVVKDLASRYLKQWRCLLLGTLCSKQYSDQVKNSVDQVLNSSQHKSYQMDNRTKNLLYLIANGCVHLTTPEIKSAVGCLVPTKQLLSDLVSALEKIQKDMSVLLAARRLPVILILDEDLDSLPWEVLPELKKHPVSRIPSIHFLHALYDEHKDFIVKGCRLVDRLDVGFYVVNPDADLKEMEQRLIRFLNTRIPQWKGIKGKSPTEMEFCDALVKNNIFMYAGHFNGSHYLRPEDLSRLRVIAIPLLFGCSSVALQELGGRTQPTGVTDKYLMAGSACVLGMLWTVTSDDADSMTVMLLNSWLPGEPIDLTSFRNDGDMLAAPKEPELLRLLRYSRDTANLFTNSAALVARGIPIKIIGS